MSGALTKVTINGQSFIFDFYKEGKSYSFHQNLIAKILWKSMTTRTLTKWPNALSNKDLLEVESMHIGVHMLLAIEKNNILPPVFLGQIMNSNPIMG